MRVGIEINGVLRDTVGKFCQIYEKEFLNDEINESLEVGSFEYKILSEITSLEMDKHFSFQSKEELYSFMFEDYVMELFGHAPSSEYTTFNDLNELYLNERDNYEFSIVSDEIGKSKPASLFFLSKFGCLIEKIRFYSNFTINSMWDEIDILLTSNPTLLLEHPSDKIVIKFDAQYNKHVSSKYSIKSIKELYEKLNEIKNAENFK